MVCRRIRQELWFQMLLLLSVEVMVASPSRLFANANAEESRGSCF